MLLLIDNYDSFTYNLVHYLGEVGAETRVVRNDALTVSEALAMRPAGIVLSPGPCTPAEAGICIDLVKAAAGTVPLLGVCLGHQSIGAAFGAKIVRAPTLMHGKTSRVRHDGAGILKGLPDPFTATRYHSLIIDAATLPDELMVTARSEDGLIMAVR
ncbi:MAG TPA: aminodeoxychorismate/anthranilate synthase component II, partial [Thermopetrobacter sp.]|nr:aminodeoxychorismate/anthranilate synthase component II [Thermopetrobacter sp.]